MNLGPVDLAHGWTYYVRAHVSGSIGGFGRALLWFLFHHPTTGWDVYAEATTQQIFESRRPSGTALTTGAHAHAVSIGALDA